MNLIVMGAVAFVLGACSGVEQAPIAYPETQRAFHLLNQQCLAAYEAGENEIQKSLAFNNCNEQRATSVQAQGARGWVGKLVDISTDQGADVVAVTIEASVDGFPIRYSTASNRLSDLAGNSLITPGSTLFNVLAQMREGDLVTFDASFLPDPEGERDLWETSLTERGSMVEPNFLVRFSRIVPLSAAASPKGVDVSAAKLKTRKVGSPAAASVATEASAQELLEAPSTHRAQTQVAPVNGEGKQQLDRCAAIQFARSYDTYGRVKWALLHSEDLSPSPPSESEPDSVAGDAAICGPETCSVIWSSYRYGSLDIVVVRDATKPESEWRVQQVNATDQGC
ncbi:MAG TPA: hypothetical protein VEY50_03855 [Lysobacter sp.]|nr:hypothetical protein [Lysobacter sp.]